MEDRRQGYTGRGGGGGGKQRLTGRARGGTGGNQ